MATSNQAVLAYAASTEWFSIPEPVQAKGDILDNDQKLLFSILFTTHRDVITGIGCQPEKQCPQELRACAAAVCELACHKAVMAAELLGPADLAALLSDDGELDDQTFYYALLAIMALKNAIASYANFRAGNLK